jgi:hypothetical protein
MKLARTIRLDVSDANVFPLSAEPGEWAVTGTFVFADSDPDGLGVKERIAFRDGWFGTKSFGRATFVQVTELGQDDYDETVRRLAAHLFQDYGAPDMMAALNAARTEVDDMAALCAHPAGTLLAIEREFAEVSITERTRVVEPMAEGQHARIWSIEDEDDGGDGPGGD